MIYFGINNLGERMIAGVREFPIIMRDLFLDMGPYLLLGITVSGILHVLLNKEIVAKHVGKRNFASIFKAAFFGVPLPLCSCGVVPAANFLKKSGASKPSVVSFLISTPQTGVDSIAATYGIMGPVLAIFRPIAALVTGLIGGVVSLFIKDEEKSDTTTSAEIKNSPSISEKEESREKSTVTKKIKEAARYAYIESIDEIAVNFIIGLLLAGLITMVIPDGFFNGTIVGKGVIGMLFMILVGIPMYICSSSSIPVAAAFIAKGISPGVAFVFLAAGPATNAASLKMIHKTLGRKQTIAFLVSIIVGSMAAGLVLDLIVNTFNLSVVPRALMTNHQQHNSVSLIEWISAGIFGLLIIVSLLRTAADKIRSFRSSRSNLSNDDSCQIFAVEGMSCKNCQSHVNRAILGVSGVENVQIDLETGRTLVQGDFNAESVINAVKAAGYKGSKS